MLPASAISKADPFITGIVEVSIDPLTIPAIFQVTLLVRNADRSAISASQTAVSAVRCSNRLRRCG
jgi:hypothetical protein